MSTENKPSQTQTPQAPVNNPPVKPQAPARPTELGTMGVDIPVAKI